MIIEIFAPHGLAVILFLFYKIRRSLDRDCTKNKRTSKKLLQRDYEQLYIGPEILMDMRLAQIIALTWVTFMYSTSIPLLFLIVSIAFSVMYWLDKYLMFRFYRLSKNYNSTPINLTTKRLRIILYFHVIVTTFTLCNKDILDSGQSQGLVDDLKDSYLYFLSDDIRNGLKMPHVKLFGIAFFIMIAMNLLSEQIANLIINCKKNSVQIDKRVALRTITTSLQNHQFSLVNT